MMSHHELATHTQKSPVTVTPLGVIQSVEEPVEKREISSRVWDTLNACRPLYQLFASVFSDALK